MRRSVTPPITFAGTARMGCTRQHSIFRRYPTFATPFQKWGHPFFHGCSAQHPRLARLDQHRAFGVIQVIDDEMHRTKLSLRTSINTYHLQIPLFVPFLSGYPAHSRLYERSFCFVSYSFVQITSTGLLSVLLSASFLPLAYRLVSIPDD